MSLLLLERGRALIGEERMRSIDIRRMIKFGIVGVSGTCVDLTIFWLLHNRLHILASLGVTGSSTITGAMSAEVAIWTNYLLNNNWTFADRRTGFISASGLTKYHLVSFGGIGIKVAVLAMLVALVGIPPLLGNLGGIGVAMVWNYVINICWTWRRRPAPAERVVAASQ